MLKHIILFFAFIFLLFSNNSFAQMKYPEYAGEWKNIDELLNKGLTRSALTAVTEIFNKAKKQGNNVQSLKALVYQVGINQEVEEEASTKNISLLEKEVQLAREPARSILQSLSARMYWTFFQQRRWRIYRRTNTENFNKADIETWTADDFHKKIGELYLASLAEIKLLQQTSLAQYEPVLIKGNVRYLRPTLYDLLAHEALGYFRSSERDITRPSYAFEVNDITAFAPAAEFIAHQFINKDSASLHYQALLIYQKLLQFHARDTRPDALIDADINRLSFVSQYGVMENKEDLSIKALENITLTLPSAPASAQAGYLVALEVFNRASEEKSAADSLSKYTLPQAKSLAEAIVQKFPESEGGINAKNLLVQILHKEINLTSEKVNVPGQPFRTLVNYKNISSINLRLIRLTPEDKNSFQNHIDENVRWKNLTAQKYFKSWKQDLPVVIDYKKHAVEIKIDPLPVGEYALLTSVAEDFNLSNNPLAVQYFYVSDISYVNNGLEYFILHRQTGKPLAGATVQVWKQEYNYQSRENSLIKQELLTADNNGYFRLEENQNVDKAKILNTERTIRLEIAYQGDKLFLDDTQNSYRYYSDDDDIASEKYSSQKVYDDKNARIFLFTDRSIYRPGQLVYFKGIGVTEDLSTGKSKLLATTDSIKVFLYDVNDGQVDSLQVVLNDFGSFKGSFRLPENKLNGKFSITVEDFDDAQIRFSVEEYKRPKFYAELEKIKGVYQVNDTVKITGFAKGYAGNNVDGALVRYRVTRVARFLYPWMFWRLPMPQTRSLEITSGEIKTGTDGKFSIEFAAIPDLSLDRKTDPVFDYKVVADITDLNGETRSASATVPVGYKALEIQMTLSPLAGINIDSFRNISVSSKNLGGEFERTKLEVKIYKLQTPQRIIRTRYWQKPDQFIMSRAEFLSAFPIDEYADENQKETWARGELAFSKTDSTTQTGKWSLETGNFQQGWYVAEAIAKDKYGQEVKDVQYFQLYDPQATALPSPAYLWNTSLSSVVEPGEKAVFSAGTSADIFLIQQLDKKPSNGRQSAVDYTFYPLNNEKKTFDFPVREEDRGGFGIHQFFVKDNRVYSYTFNVLVPWTNKQLDITYQTFRDKTLPGSEEKWKVKISGSKGDKVAAEMLAGMYDASLDQFRPHNWKVPDIWPNHFTYNGWSSVQNFTPVQSIENWLYEAYAQQKDKRYDQLLHGDGNVFGYKRKRDITGSMVARAPAAAPETMVQDLQLSEISVTALGITRKESSGKNPEKETNADQSQTQIRKNFNETAFFFPDLRTDKEGNVEFSFSMPEALTQWKLLTLAHTKNLSLGYAEKTVITQKELMVQPNAPRFVREGDSLVFSAKIVNLSATAITGKAQLQLLKAGTMGAVDALFKNILTLQPFTIAAGQSAAVKFNIIIPENYNDALVYRITAKVPEQGGLAGASDGEEAAIPVLTNRMLVTETMPLPVKGNGTKNFTFNKLLGSAKSNTLSNHALTIEFTTNPAWYAVQALPYLMEYPYDCSEQTFNRYYANSIATKIVNASPKLKAIFETWKTADTAALLSNLQKNEDLKSVLLAETPWVLEAKHENLQKKNIALLFDMARMSIELKSSLDKLRDMQSPNGGFVWFKGGPDDRYITQYIITGLGHLQKLNAIPEDQQGQILSVIKPAMLYLDRALKEDYDRLIKESKSAKTFYRNVAPLYIQYLYMRSFFPQYVIAKETGAAYNYYLDQSKKNWLTQGKYMQAMTALFLSRTGDAATARAIIKSLKENSINNEELGMYWKEFNQRGYWWYQAPIESQALMIEAFAEIDQNIAVIDDLKTWLLKNKQTNNWGTTKATAEACYALLLQGTDWLSQQRELSLKLGSVSIRSNDEHQEAGTGYFKRRIESDQVKAEMGNVSVTLTSPAGSASAASPPSGAAWGAVYWQYFENLDKITFAETPLKLNKKLFIEKNTARGPVLSHISGGTEVKVGDKIKVRIELRVDRDMEYLHMKDMRASGMEPVNVISRYKYQDGLGYYETTKDVSTNFFFNYLPKGTYVFEYSLFATHNGNFSNGVTTIQCMYAPEFTAHSEGVRLHVGN